MKKIVLFLFVAIYSFIDISSVLAAQHTVSGCCDGRNDPANPCMVNVTSERCVQDSGSWNDFYGKCENDKCVATPNEEPGCCCQNDKLNCSSKTKGSCGYGAKFWRYYDVCEVACVGCTDSTYTPNDVLNTEEPSKPIKFTPEVGFPGFTSEIVVDGSFFGTFVSSLLKYLIYLSTIVAVIMVMVAGFLWVSAGGNQSKISDAKSRITSALTGLFLCFASVLILQTINPDLINIKSLNIETIDRVNLPDSTEPVTLTKEIETAKGNAIAIPQYTGICSNNKSATPAAIEKLKLAADCMKKSNLVIKVASGVRWIGEQQSLYSKNCKTTVKNGKTICAGSCTTPTCCPYPGDEIICPHSAGVALDVWGASSCDKKATLATQDVLQTCMISAGFCLLGGECWHFEYPQLSGSCSKTHNSKCLGKI